MSDDTFGNILDQGKIAYIVGDDYPMISNLSRVMTMTQFTIAVLEQHLPINRLWIVGQGVKHHELQFLRLCEVHIPGIRFYFGAQRIATLIENFCAQTPCEMLTTNDDEKNLEWHDFHFIDATRVEAELSVKNISEADFLRQDFLFKASSELTRHACQSAISEGVLVIKQSTLLSFHRLFPLPIKVEAKFQLLQDNKRSLKSIVRFYQGYTCAAEASLSFDLYSKEDADEFYQELAEKTLSQLSKKIEDY